MSEQTKAEIAEILKFAELLADEPCELYAFHIRELAASVLYAMHSA